MLEFPEPPKGYSDIYLEETDKDLPVKIDQNTRYAFFQTIAKGGKSLIKSCKDMHLSRVVAYKTLRPEFADDPVEQKRLLREARVSAMLQHPNTVPTYELGRDKRGNYYFTMKLVHGYTLREVLNYRDRYDLTQLIDVIIQIGFALEYAHSHGVAHRDIKPDNILVGPYGEVVLLDWGLAKVWREDGSAVATEQEVGSIAGSDISMTGHAQLQGTVCYMSPEQVRKDPDISYQTDIYSLGAVLYEVLTGKTPFVGEKVHEVIAQVLESTPVQPAQASNMRVPNLLDQLAMRCLAKSPTDRVDSISEVVRLLQEDWRIDLR
ncbi:MAG: protein kinase [Pseudomonadales bacterium]|nr:protein kinase [Pseudomonadales bacterium]